MSLSLFSPNETLPDISTRDLVYLFVPFALAEVENRARTTDMQERMVRIGRAQVSLFQVPSILLTVTVMSLGIPQGISIIS